eukprot:jgi/Ulvmu1/2897/UM146_0039.1
MSYAPQPAGYPAPAAPPPAYPGGATGVPPGVPPGVSPAGAPPQGYGAAPGGPSQGQFFTSPEGFQPTHQGQASYNEQDEFNDPSGKYKLVMKGAYAAVECALTPNDLVKAESGAMVTMSSGVDVEAKLEGGAGAAAFRSCCAGESLFMSHFKLKPGMGNRHDLLLAPAVPGDIMLVHLNGSQSWAIQKASFMACDETVAIGTKVQGLAAACCSGEGLFVLKATGVGRLLINSYGGIIRYDLKPGEVRKIDNGYLVAWHEQMDYKISKAGSSLIGSFLSGEGFVCSFTGPGTVYVQTRSIVGLAHAIQPYIAPAAGGGGGGAGVDIGGF